MKAADKKAIFLEGVQIVSEIAVATLVSALLSEALPKGMHPVKQIACKFGAYVACTYIIDKCGSNFRGEVEAIVDTLDISLKGATNGRLGE